MDANVTGEWSHRVVDHPLTPPGWAQAGAVAGHIAASPVASTPRRCGVPCAIVDASGVGVLIDERLREIDVGTLDGRSDAWAWAVQAEVHRARPAGEHDRRFPGRESRRELADRLRAALADIVAAAGAASSVVVGHGGIVRAALPHPCVPGTRLPTIDMANCSVTELELRLDGIDPTDTDVTAPARAWGEPCSPARWCVWGRADHLPQR